MCEGATHLHVFSYTQNNDWFFNQGILSTKAYIIPVMDLGAQVPVPDRVGAPFGPFDGTTLVEWLERSDSVSRNAVLESAC